MAVPRGQNKCHQEHCFLTVSVSGISTSLQAPPGSSFLVAVDLLHTQSLLARLPHPEEERNTFPGRPAGILGLRRMLLLKRIPRGLLRTQLCSQSSVTYGCEQGKNVPRKFGESTHNSSLFIDLSHLLVEQEQDPTNPRQTSSADPCFKQHFFY